MNNAVHFIQTLIDKIENNLDQEISIEHLASSFNVSQWHFQRLFKALVGDTLGAYIKGRRLSTGANLLRNSQHGITDIAFSVGFNSHEAFSRSFKHEYGLSPKVFRLQKLAFNPKEKPILSELLLAHLSQGMSKQPNITLRPATPLVGYQVQIPSPFLKDVNQCMSLYPAWKQIMKHQDQVENRIEGSFYGLTCSESGQFTEQDMDYIACVPVTSLAQYPFNAKVYHLPEQQVAMFDVHVATLESTERTIDYIYGYWLPNSPYERASGDDYEVFENVNDFTNPDELKSRYVIPIRERK